MKNRLPTIAGICAAMLVSANGAHAALNRPLASLALPSAAEKSALVGPLATTNQLKLAIALPLRNQPELTRLLKELSDPASPNFRRYLTPEEFAARFGPTTKDYQAVISFARAHGLATRGTHPNRTLVDVSGSVAAVQKAFGLTLQVYRHPNEKRTFYAPSTVPTLNLTVPVLAVSGLSDYARPQPRLQATPLDEQSGPTPNAGTGSGPSGTFMGNDFRAAYVPGTTLTGAGQSVGLVQFDGYSASDITYYESHAGLPNVPLVNVLLDGFNGAPSGGGGTVEVCLDIETAISMAPGLTQVIVYMAGPYGNFHDVLNRMATDNLAKQLSCSWYMPGAGADAIADQIFQQMAAQGQSFYNASGDYDAFTGPVDFPGETPYITQVGGTTLTTASPGGAWSSEKVWNWGGGIGTGGGISTRYAIPSYQTNISMALNQGSTTMRNIPDVALTADNVYVRANGRDYNVGGTSCAAPLWGGFGALINQLAVASGRPPVGFINAAVDAIGSGATYTTCFHDITVGNNTSSGSPTKFYAVTGYDLCTGWGTPAGPSLITALATPDALIINPAALAFSGDVGGPFTPSPGLLTLTNVGTNMLSWTLVNTSALFTASPASGTLQSQGPSSNVSVSVTAAAASLPAGVYSAVLKFTNLNNQSAQIRPLTLSVAAAGMADDFEPAIDLPQWSAFGGTVGSTVRATNYGGSVSAPNSLWFGDSGSRFATTIPVDTLGGGQIGFCLRLANGTNWPWAKVTDLSSQGIILECSTNGGGSWTALGSYNTPTYFNWTGVAMPIPAAAQSPATLFRWRQPSNSGTNSAHWALDNVIVGTGSFGPTIVMDPQSQNSAAGDPASLSIAAVGTQPLSYQWLLNGSNIAGATSSSLTWTNIQLTDAGTYSVFLSNSVGTAMSSNAILTVYVPVCAPPSTALVSWWRGEGDGSDFYGTNNGGLQGGVTFAQGRVGQAFNFDPASGTVIAADSPSLDLTNQLTIEAWINPRSAKTDQAIVSKIGGAAGNNGYQFMLSGATFLGQFNSPGLSWPSSKIVSGGVIATGVWTHLAWTYDQSTMKLYLNGQLIASSVIGPKTIVNSSSTLRISGDDNNHVYFDGLIDEPAIYNRALSDVEIAAIYNAGNVGKCRTPTPPAILNQPKDLTVAVGASASFGVAAAGTRPLSYQWRFNGTNLVAATNASLALSGVQLGDSGSYDVLVTNAYGSTNSAPGILTVLLPPQITGQPQDQTVPSGTNVTFTVTVTGSTPLSYQWSFNGTPLAAATNSALTIFNVSLIQSGSYSVSISNLVGSVLSSNALLVIQGGGTCVPAPSGLVSWWAAEGSGDDSVSTNKGTLQGGVTFLPGADGLAFNFDSSSGTVIVPDAPSLNLTNQLTIEAWINTKSTNTDRSIVSKIGGAGGNNGYQFMLSGNAFQGIFNSPGQSWPSSTIVSGGVINTGVWTHLAWTYDQSAMKLYLNGQPVATNVIGAHPIASSISRLRISGDENNHVYFDGLIDEPAVYNRALSASEIAAIYGAGNAGKCHLPPGILTQPQNATVLAGSTVTFSASASGSPPLTYRWQFNGSPMAGTTTNSLTITNVQAGQAGSYALVVTNSVGSITSSAAVLAIASGPPCASPPSGLVSWWAGESSANDMYGINNGSIQGATTFSPGKVGQAFTFDPANGTVIVPDSSSLRITNQVTIDAWINTRSINTDRAIVSKVGGAAGNNGYQFMLSGNTFLGQFNSPGQSWPYSRIISGGVITTGVWTHLAWTYDQSAMKLYLNGQPILTNIIGSRTITASSSNLRISGDDNNHVYFDGQIDEPSIYNRALSAVEIAAIYNASVSGKCVPQPVIVTPPANKTNEYLSDVTFSVSASGALPLSYRWYFGTNAISGGTNSLLTLSHATFASAGQYSVVVSNIYGTATGGPAMLTVVDTTPPTILACASNRVLSVGANCIAILPDLTGDVVAGDASGPVIISQSPPPGTVLQIGATNVAFTVTDSSTNVSGCVATITVADTTPPFILASVPEIAVGFDSNCMALLPDLTTTNYFIASDNCSSVTITQVPPPGTALLPGTNLVVVTFSDGSSNQTTRSVDVIVPREPHIATQPASASVIVTSNATLNVLACGAATLRYQWQHAGTNVPNATNVVLSLINVSTNDGGSYTVIITNTVAAITSDVAVLTILQPPVITRQPSSVAAAPGGMASFSVTAKGLTPFSFQWQKDGSALSGQTKASITLSNVQFADFGSYSVGVTNNDGGVLSQPGLLTLATSPVIAGPTINLATCTLSVPTEVGPIYVLEYKEDLADPVWKTLATLAGTGSSIPVTDNNLTNTSRFYRIRVR